jgi:hypothetical protein
MRNTSFATVSAAVAASLLGLAGYAAGQEVKPKYYFNLSGVTAEDSKIIPLAKELLAKEVSSRPEFTDDLGGAEGAAALAELKKRGLEGYQVNMRITSLRREVKPPAPGRRDQQMAIEVKLSVFGTTYPGNKVKFTGDGDSSLVGEFSERRKDKDVEEMLRTALAGAIKQAVSNASLKLGSETRALGAPASKKKKRPKARK